MTVDRQEIIQEYQINDKDTGSIEVQIAILSHRIRHLTEHLKIHKKDFHCRRGLLKMVGRRRKMLRYVKKNKPEVYLELIKKLGIRG